jgi:energy-coupling factor transporter ATP-binding protein EcfA2
MTGENRVCGDCEKYLVRWESDRPDETCPRAEYKDRDRNKVACAPSDSACELFQPKSRGAHGSHGDDRKSQADTLILLCLAQNPELFHDQHDTPYARIKQKNVKVIFPIRSRSFKVWLANLLWEGEEKAPSADALAGALNVLQAKALYEGPKHTLYNRVAPATDGFWVDMADENWRAIKVTGEGWEIVDNPPILFKRFSHQKPLPTPNPEGSPWGLLDFLNIDKKDEATRLLFLCAVISYFIPLIPHVIVVLYGIQGSGKSTLFKIIRRVVDPSAVEVLTLPRNERERVQQLDHHWCAFYDNITSLPSWMSDTLCRAATGGGFTKRELYTNDHDIIYNFKRCVGLNGINIAAQRGDLLDRSLLVGLEDIPKKKRRTEEQLLKDFEASKPYILGGFLNTLVKAIREYPYVKPKELFRMADFTRWGCAIAKALGKTEKEFLEAYNIKVKLQIEEAAHSSPVATVLIDFLSNHKNWKGTPSNLFKILLGHAKDMGISTRQKAFPKAPHILVRKLNELAPSLKALGLEVVTGVRTPTHRLILINSVNSVKALTEDQNDATDAINASPQSSSSRIDEAFVTTCFLCNKLLPRDLAYCTYLDGKPVHCSCARKVEAQKKKPVTTVTGQCKNLTTLEGDPYCKFLESLLADSKQCGPDCAGWEVSS